MKLNYYPETDSLYIDLSENPSSESREIAEGIVLDFDERGALVGIDIDNASRKLELTRLVLSGMPVGSTSPFDDAADGLSRPSGRNHASGGQ